MVGGSWGQVNLWLKDQTKVKIPTQAKIRREWGTFYALLVSISLLLFSLRLHPRLLLTC